VTFVPPVRASPSVPYSVPPPSLRTCGATGNLAVGTSIARPPEVRLTEIGKQVETAIVSIPTHYPCVSVDRYVIMPNHVHLLLKIERNGRAMLVPTVSHVMQQMKGAATKKAGFPIWQTRFFDHIIRDERDYLIRAEYIESNPARWAEDEYNPDL
ncbi:MAG: transposase, partial [Oscillospiraceae bacterium]|nr:transposase [Oscillospiraceae bacterium]